MLFPPNFIYFSWFCLLVYYLGGLGYIAWWILGRDTVSKGLLIDGGDPDPNTDEIAIESNIILTQWLVGSFIGSGFLYCIL
jgi:hypothetical protein